MAKRWTKMPWSSARELVKTPGQEPAAHPAGVILCYRGDAPAYLPFNLSPSVGKERRRKGNCSQGKGR